MGVNAMNILLKNTPHRVRNAVAPDLFIETYPGPLEQIFDNLVQNAVVHAFDQEQEGAIVIANSTSDDFGITLVVSDNGKGIAPEHLNRVFDPFFTTRLGQGGSGLGLNIVYNLSRGILGGQISVTSTRGIGTEFRLKLPWVAPHGEPGGNRL